MKLMKKILAFSFAGAMGLLNVLAGGGASLIAKAEESVPAGYTAIHNIEELYAVRNNLSGKYILMNDIDMTEDTAPGGDWDINGTGWEPIGGYGDDIDDISKAFKGEFDGNGHAIIGMNIHGVPQYNYVGLFGYCSGAEIKNIKMIDCDINIDSGSIGTIVGRIDGYHKTNIYNCYASGSIKTECGSIGGIVGYMDANSNFSHKIHDCYNAVDISVATNSNAYVGGIVGRGRDYSYGEISNCYNTGNITSESSNVGAVCGINGNMSYCYYLAGTCEGQESTSGVCQSMSVAQMKSQGAYTNWDFENTWIIDSTSSYKYPQLRSCMQVPVSEVKITSVPEKTVYTSGETLDLTGGKVLINHEDNSSGELEIKENMIGEYNMEQVGKQSINVNYINKSASYDITINPKPVANLKISSLTNESCSLSWDRVTGAAGYIIYKYDSEKKQWNEYQRVAKNNFTDNSENLSSKDFKYAVSAYVNIDNVDYISEKTEILKPVDFSLAVINIDDIICNGESQTVVPEVSYNGKILTEGTDYDITGGDYEVKTPGTYKLTLTGKGSFAGEQEVEFNAICNHKWGEDGKSNKCSICGELRYIIGDANEDGKLTIDDADYIIKMISEGKADKLSGAADFNGDSEINPSDAYLICCEIKGVTPSESYGEILLAPNMSGGYPGEQAAVTIFTNEDEFYAFDFTVKVNSMFNIVGEEGVAALIKYDKNITCYSCKNGNTIRFTGYANAGKIGGNGDIIGILAFYVDIPEDASVGEYETVIDTDSDSYVGGSNDNTDNFYVSSAPFLVQASGDANGDGVVNVRDAAFIAIKISQGKGKELPSNADYNNDGIVNIRDAAAIARSLSMKN